MTSSENQGFSAHAQKFAHAHTFLSDFFALKKERKEPSSNPQPLGRLT